MKVKLANIKLINFKLMATLSAVIFLSACSKDSPTPAAPKKIPELASIQLSLQTTAQEVKYDGMIEAINQATVSAQTSGRIVEIPVDVGDLVAKGDLIIRFTDTEQKARAASAKAQFTEAQAQYTRMQEMLAKKLIAKADFDKSEAAFKSAEANLREAEQNLAYTAIYAPYAGIVVSRAVNVGETVSPGKALMTGLSLEQLRAQVDIPQQHIGPVRKYKKALIYLADGNTLESSDLRIPPSADPQTHSFKVLVNLPEGDHQLFPGTFVKIAFVTGEREQLLIPASAISKRGEVSGVYVIKEDALEFRQLNLGSPTRNKDYPILAGASAGEKIAADSIAAAIAYKNLHSAEQ
ncbi:MAG: efflux RND transporter periplasmic adaptor subunit [Cellvibrio sp.]|uniref:efflux RND transporter periplasmic adaptor subunit n=1 Tax=Cellvibrio sp. TaxID=1965322 RepID=UPI00271CA836|nr:efflux RND transporter periplasmic adaptor subunit [Cellvibrio sp.]